MVLLIWIIWLLHSIFFVLKMFVLYFDLYAGAPLFISNLLYHAFDIFLTSLVSSEAD